MDDLLLAGDVGATKIALALVDRERGAADPVASAVYPSADFDGLVPALERFVAESGTRAVAASLGVPGPVIDGRSRLTLLGWDVDASEIADRLALRAVRLVNDVQAAAAAVPHLRGDQLDTLAPGEPVPGGAIAVVAPGTGLGEAFLTWDGRRYAAHPTEGGHTDFGSASPEEDALLAFLRAAHGRVSVERVCSGSALPEVYAFHRRRLGWGSPAVDRALASGRDATPAIVADALGTAPSPACRSAVETFVRALAAECSNLALKTLATGGIYLAGGLPPRLLSLLRRPEFLAHLRDKGRYTDLVARMPVHVVLEPRAALLGAAHEGLAAGIDL